MLNELDQKRTFRPKINIDLCSVFTGEYKTKIQADMFQICYYAF